MAFAAGSKSGKQCFLPLSAVGRHGCGMAASAKIAMEIVQNEG